MCDTLLINMADTGSWVCGDYISIFRNWEREGGVRERLREFLNENPRTIRTTATQVIPRSLAFGRRQQIRNIGFRGHTQLKALFLNGLLKHCGIEIFLTCCTFCKS